MKLEKWQNLMSHFDFQENILEFNKIKDAYNEKHRFYHDESHVTNCLLLTELNTETATNNELKLAIWYHDVIYNIFKKNNEILSAIEAEKFLIKQSANPAIISNVKRLIISTIHKEEPQQEDEAYLMDIDISILGASKVQYENYCLQIRKEYKMIPWFIYRKKRIEVLKMFLDRKTLYFTDYFKNKYELKARENLANEIITLEK